MKTLFPLLILAGLSLVTPTFAAVVINDASIGANIFGPNQFSVANTNCSLSVTATTATSFTFQYNAIAEGYGLFRMTLGTQLNAAYVNANPEWVNNWGTPGSATLTLGIGSSTLIGYWDQQGNSFGRGNVAFDIDLYGWARIQNQAGSLVVTGSASNIGGIEIGSTIPEPGCVMMALLAAGLCFNRSRSR